MRLFNVGTASAMILGSAFFLRIGKDKRREPLFVWLGIADHFVAEIANDLELQPDYYLVGFPKKASGSFVLQPC